MLYEVITFDGWPLEYPADDEDKHEQVGRHVVVGHPLQSAFHGCSPALTGRSFNPSYNFV